MDNNFGEWTLYSGESITDEIFNEMLELDGQLFTEEAGTNLGKEYIKSLYQDSREGVFIIRNERTKEIVGYTFSIAISKEQLQQYLEDHDYSKLKNIGMREGKNILYIYTLASNPKYRGTIAQKILGKALAEYVIKCNQENKEIGYCFAEAVSSDGAKALTRSMGMVEMEGEHGSDGTGFYHFDSIEAFKRYIEKMNGFDYSLYTQPSEENPIPKREVKVNEVKEVAEGEKRESKNRAINAVTSSGEEKNKEGQSHNDE